MAVPDNTNMDNQADTADHTLRHRIAGLTLLATAVMMIAVFGMIYILVEHAVFRHMDSELEEEAVEFAETLHVSGEDLSVCDDREWMERPHITADFNPEFAQVVVVGQSPEIIKKSFNLFSDTLTYAHGLTSVTFSSETVGTDPVRQVQYPVFGQKKSLLGYVIVAVPLWEALLVLHDLRMVLLVALPVILLVLFFVTRFIAEKSIEPIEKVIDTAENITRSNLDERILLPSRRDELYRLSQTINALLDRLRDAYVRERQFTADASHELKTPLASVMGTLEVLIRKPRTQERYEEKIRFCIDELQRMHRLIEQLLLLARIDGKIEIPGAAPVELSKLIPVVVGRFRSYAEEKNISLSLEANGSGRCLADEGMLEIMLENLIGNAVKYSPENSTIRIKCETRGTLVRCTISNRGKSIPQESLKRLFDRFYRVDASRASRVEGSGLGLSVVKKLADAQGIAIRVKSTDIQETVFIIEMQKV